MNIKWEPGTDGPLYALDAQERAGVTAIWFVPDAEGQQPYVALEMLGGPKRYARVWLDQLTSPEAMGRVDWGWRIAESAVCVWRTARAEDSGGPVATIQPGDRS